MESSLFTLGRHLLAEFHDCDSNILNNVSLIETAMADAARVAGATIVQQTFHHFSPYGVSGVVVIAESHLAIHTWPEYGYAAVDLFTCGTSVDPVVSYDYLREQLHAKTAFYSELKRGLLDSKTNEMVKVPFQTVMGHEALPVQPIHHSETTQAETSQTQNIKAQPQEVTR